ncbi:phosphoribosyltransferase-like protein [Aliarcobacter butzleri]|uniref:phosphoribosyltransferase-like protein n=1 Tax=Aliarcobacter butzleri TaxID=28197 RepID=UPI00263E5DDC|nr:hypothetical protein [Aliarcobacter butzleri]MDN5049679.1 hypothetical protein [Aliarcobacter butzleri]MDN5056518.1 hypothetical protein [Aliarcobacter butzleri]
MTRELYRKLTNLLNNNEWLKVGDREKDLENLLFEECCDNKDIEFLLELIDNFLYIDNSKYYNDLKSIVDEMTSTYNAKSTAIFAITKGYFPDSAQHLIYELKTMLVNYSDWDEVPIITTMNKPIYKYEGINLSIIKNLVLIDEFNGSGKTALQRYTQICDDLERKGLDKNDYTIQYYYITSMNEAHKLIEDESVCIKSINKLDKAITGTDDDIEKKKRLEILSSALSPKYKNEVLNFLGYGDAEALYVRERGNTPNSVLPIFWWPRYFDETNRKSILKRSI